MADSKHSKRSDWFCGFLLSCLIMWAVCGVAKPLYPNYRWYDQLAATLPMEGSYHWETREGWALTRYGPYGTIGKLDLSIKSPTMLLWGDSHVEGVQVWDRQKMHVQMNAMLAESEEGEKELVAAVGISGAMIADYIQWIPAYENVFPEVKKHLILITTIGDVLPDGTTALHAKFTSNPEFNIVFEKQRRASVKGRMLMDFIHDYRMQFFQVMEMKIKNFINFKRLKFFKLSKIGECEVSQSAYKDRRHLKIDKAFAYLASTLKSVTDKEIVLLYAPTLYDVKNGRIVSIPATNTFKVLESNFNLFGIKCYDLSYELQKKAKACDCFPRGQMNGTPIEGHYNSKGHKMLAEIIVNKIVSK